MILLICFLLWCTAPSLAADLAGYNSSMFWGTYRPNLYFGTRTRSALSLLSGLAWFGLDDLDGINHIRHGCDIGDKLDAYMWESHNGRNFGSQLIKDPKAKVALKTQFVKASSGQSWSVRITGDSYAATGKTSTVSLYYYFAQEGGTAEGSLNLVKSSKQRTLASLDLKGNSKTLGDYSVSVQLSQGKAPKETKEYRSSVPDVSQFGVVGTNVPQGSEWKAQQIILNTVKEAAELRIQKLKLHESSAHFPTSAQMLALGQHSVNDATFVLIQKQVVTPFVIDIAFASADDKTLLLGDALSEAIAQKQAEFDVSFEAKFPLSNKGFRAEQIAFGKSVFSNLIGGMGYFYGEWLVDRAPYSSEAEEAEADDDLLDPILADYDEDEELLDDEDYEIRQLAKSKHRAEVRKKEIQTVGPNSLFTAVPSRPFFPRGFLWDEGFHQILIGQFDNDISLDSIRSWFDLLDNDGWLAREQILGEEARSRVPAEFQVQYPRHANPPTLLLPVFAYIQRIISSDFSGNDVDGVYLSRKPKAISYLEEIYPKLKLRYEWLKETQAGDFTRYRRRLKVPVGFRWRGRVGIHTLSSGLDDYPRAFPPSVGELHLDLISWLAWYAHGLNQIAEFLLVEKRSLTLLDVDALQKDNAEFANDYDEMKEAISENHWSTDENLFCDIAGVGIYGRTEYECHAGYISLFPFFLQLLDKDDARIEHVLNIIEDKEVLWSEFGLRSLSKNDEFFGKDENYWRGPIWLNINYLVCKALWQYKKQHSIYSDRMQRIYEALRGNLINNLFKEYTRTGFVWEQYSPVDGTGKRAHPFTGWTSLVVALMAENY